MIREWPYLKGLGGVALLEEVWFSKAQASSSSFLILLPVDLDVELSAPSPAPRLPARCHASRHDDKGLNF